MGDGHTRLRARNEDRLGQSQPLGALGVGVELLLDVRSADEDSLGVLLDERMESEVRLGFGRAADLQGGRQRSGCNVLAASLDGSDSFSMTPFQWPAARPPST